MKTTALIAANVRALLQARDVLLDLPDRMYAQPAPCATGVRIGAHLRHVLEFYEAFLTGMERGLIDYDARRRNGLVETSRAAGLQLLDELIARLESMPPIRTDSPLHVYADETDAVLTSSAGREMQVLLCHTIHHFAMVAVALNAYGVAVDPTFGVASATLRYRARAAETA